MLQIGMGNQKLIWTILMSAKKDRFLSIGKLYRLKDKLSKIRDVYLNADYFCLPSFYEGTPNALCETISCGLTLVCSDVCNNSTYAQKGENVFV